MSGIGETAWRYIATDPDSKVGDSGEQCPATVLAFVTHVTGIGHFKPRVNKTGMLYFLLFSVSNSPIVFM